MRVKVDPSLQSLSGRWSKKDTTVVALNKHTGKMHQYIMNDEARYPNTEDQQAVKTIFTSKSRAAAAWWNANKPSASNAKGTEDYQKMKEAYDHQYKIGNIYLYVRSRVNDEFVVVVPGSTVPEGGGNQGGSGSGSGSGSGGGGDDPDGEGALS